MAKTDHYADIDLHKNQLLRARLENLASAPASPGLGQMYFDTTLDDGFIYTSANAWVSLTAGSGGSSVSLLVDFVATENIGAFLVVTANGKNADSNNALHQNRILGISTAAVANTFAGQAVKAGEITNPAWTWNAGDFIYLNGTSLSTTPPQSGTSVYSIVIGIAISPDTIDVAIKQAFGL